jgi:adenosylcobinamide-GDP ribazoletransferase
MIGSFFLALRRLSVLPLGERPPEAAGRESEELVLFPLAGLAVGVLPALVLVVLGAVGLGAPLPEALAVATLAAVTGLAHLGELGRTAEAMVSGRPALGALEVMRDVRVGASGAAAVTLVLLGKFAALVSLRGEMPRSALGSTVGLVIAVLLAACIARWSAVMVASYSEYARPEGGSDEALIASASGREVPWALILTGGATLVLSLLGIGTLGIWRGLLALAGCSLFAWFAASYFSRRFGGATSECMGAVIEIAEVLALVLMCLLPAAARSAPPETSPPPRKIVAPVAPEKPSPPPGEEKAEPPARPPAQPRGAKERS